MCVHPWTKGFDRLSHHQRRHSRFPGDTGTDHPSIPALIASCDTNFPLVCFHGPCMIPPPKPFLQPRCSAAEPRRSIVSADLTNNLLKHLQVFRTLHHAVLSPSFPAWELSSLNTSVRVCFAQPSHSGAECDPRHRGAVFTSESNQPNMPPLTGFPLEVIDTPFESTDALAAGRNTVTFSSTSFQISHARCFSTIAKPPMRQVPQPPPR